MKEKSKGNWTHKKFIITRVLSVEHDRNGKMMNQGRNKSGCSGLPRRHVGKEGEFQWNEPVSIFYAVEMIFIFAPDVGNT